MILYIQQNLQENTCTKISFLVKLLEVCNFTKKEPLTQVFSSDFCKIFKNIFFTEQLRVTTSDTRMQVFVIHNLNLSFQFVTINFKFCLLQIFTLAHASMLLEFLQRFVFWQNYFQRHTAISLLKKIITKHNIQKNSYSQFSQQIAGRSHHDSGVDSELQLFNENSARSNVIIRTKVTRQKITILV